MFTETQNHRHTGADAPRINPKDLMGFPVFESDGLNHDSLQGTILIRKNPDDSTYYLSVYIDGVWRETELTSIAS